MFFLPRALLKHCWSTPKALSEHSQSIVRASQSTSRAPTELLRIPYTLSLTSYQ
ncbi:hypothetical protein B0H34DRAFT_682202 [Crassisporium funariophilum]|nr:hypothetical protein B0H34DRAFT_682202 [Crassisporium funariophilum]